MVQKKFGDVVTFSRQGTDCNALVIASRDVAGLEHLTLFYLNPGAAATVLTGAQIEQATLKVFDVPPIREGLAFGWKNTDGSLGDVEAATAVPLPTSLDNRGFSQDARGQMVQKQGPVLDDTLEDERRKQIVSNDPQKDTFSATAPQRDPSTTPASSPVSAALPEHDDKDKAGHELNPSEGKGDVEDEHFDAKTPIEELIDDHKKTKLPTNQETIVPGLDPIQKMNVMAGNEIHIAEYEDKTTAVGAKPLPEESVNGAAKVREFEHPESQAWHADNRGPQDKSYVEEHKNDEAIVEATAPQNPMEDPLPPSSAVSE